MAGKGVAVAEILAYCSDCLILKFPLVERLFSLGGVEVPLRPNMGVFTQPISCIGLPVVAVPIPLQPMPIGVQVIAAPWREAVDPGVDASFLVEERRKAQEGLRTEDCRSGRCGACGVCGRWASGC